MNILFDAEDFKNRPRGIVKTTLCLYLACLKLDPTLKFTALARKPLAVSLPGPIDIVTLKPDLPRYIWRFLMYNTYLATHDCTAVHFPSNGLIPRIMPNHLAILTLHDILPVIIPGYFSSHSKERRYRRRRQNDIDRADLLFTVSESSKKDIMKNFQVHTEPVVLYNAPTMTPHVYDPLYDISKTGNYFLFYGGYDQRKGLDRLLRVYLNLFLSRRLNCPLYLAGTPSYYSEKFKQLVDEGTVMGAVKELGYLSDEDLIPLLRKAKALIYPSFYEGFGLPPIEAMNIGCPVITTRFSAIPEVCGDAVLYVDPENDREFGDAIVSLIDNGALRRELIERGKKQADNYSWSKSASLFLENIQTLRARRGVGSP